MLKLANARVFDGKALLPGLHTITVDNGRITAIEAGPTADSDTINLAGMTLMPGMITSHFHPDFYKFTLAQGLSGEPLGTELPPAVLAAIGVRNCGVLLESGFTGYIGASCANDLDAQLKIAIAEGIMAGPRIRACSPHIGTISDVNDSKRWWRRLQSSGTDVFGSGPDELRRMVREYIRKGSEIIKIFASRGHGFPSPFVRNMDTDEIAAIVKAAHGRGAMVRAHVADKAMMLECIALGVDIIDHGDEIDDQVIEAMVEAGTYWVPSLIYPKCLMELGWAEVDTPALYENVRRYLPIAHKAGVRILVGDDYSGVFRDVIPNDPLDHQVGNYGREFAYYADIDGLTPADVLQWGTRNAGQALTNNLDMLGVVAEGALADLIVVDGNPLDDLTLLSQPDTYLKAVIRDGAFVINRLPPLPQKQIPNSTGRIAA